jgi:hypothetical protein
VTTPRRPVSRLPVLLLAVLFLAQGAAYLAWLRQDATPFAAVDDYGYLSRLVRYADALAGRGPEPSLAALSFHGRPPAIQLLTLPFLAAFGRSEDAAVAVNLPFLAVLLGAAYALGRRLRGPWTGLVAAVLLSGYPPVVHLFLSYRPSFAVVAWVALAAWALVRLLEARTVGRALALGAIAGFGLLLHPYFLWVLGPAAAIGGVVAGWRGAPAAVGVPTGRWRDPFLWRGLAGGAALALAIALPWYLGPGSTLFETLAGTFAADLDAFRGFSVFAVEFQQVEPGFLWYLKTLPRVLPVPLALLAVAGAAAALRRPGRPEGVLAFGLAGAYVILSLQSTLSWLHAAGALPLAAALSAVALADLRPAWLRRGAQGAAAALALFAFAFVLAGGPRPVVEVARALGARTPHRIVCQASRGFCAMPPEERAPPAAQALAMAIADEACEKRRQPCSLLVAGGAAGINHAQLEYLLARDWPAARLVVQRQLHAAWGVPYSFRGLLWADYLLTAELSGERPPLPPRASYPAATERLLNWPPEPFARAHRRVASYPLGAGGRLQLIRRVRPLSREEAEATIAALEIPEQQKTDGAVLLEQLAERDRRRAAEAPATAPQRPSPSAP